MRTLMTTSRMPFAVDEIRKLGETGNEVTAVDTFSASPGSHSRYVARHLEVPAPAQQTEQFVDAIAAIIAEHQIEWVLPMFEEVFYLSYHRDRLESAATADQGVNLFFPAFDTLAKVHDKVTFAGLCRQLGLPVAESVAATTTEQLKDATTKWDHWFARAAYGRGGLNVLTNTGPLASEGRLDDADPSDTDPWLVQEYLDGVDLCSWSVVHDGEVVLHSTYEHALTIDDRGGIVFEAIDSPETLAATQKLVGELGWNGQVSFDFLRTADGVHHLVECNPRPTDGCTLATPEEFDAALFGSRPAEPVVVPAGRKREIKEAVLRDMFEHLGRLRSDLHAAKGGSDVYGQHGDNLPLLYTVFSLQHVKAYRQAMGIDHKSRQDLTAAQFFDVAWDGGPIS